ncbi:MAG: hypothetical protein IT334_07315 [Thermomicrobiales bacterium]|nr:hypothetical protein [Thermomicrobiales bacterium]
MATVHMIVGGVVILLYLAAVVGYLQGTKGATPPWAKMVSRLGAVLVLLQYALGFSLLGTSDSLPSPIHYVVALATAFTIGAEHMVAGQETDPVQRNRKSLMFCLGTLVLVLVAFAIGESTS